MSDAIFIDSFFNTVFDRVENALWFNPDWANGTGYFDHAVEGPEAPALEAGEMAKSVDNFGRPMILVGTPVGNLVVFKRYSKQSGVYTYNASRAFDEAWMGVHCQGKQTLEDLKKFFGEWSDSENIGQVMAQWYRPAEGSRKIDIEKELLDMHALNPFGGTCQGDNRAQMFKQVDDVAADQKVAERNRARQNLESWISENIDLNKQDQLRTLIAAYSVSSAAVHQS